MPLCSYLTQLKGKPTGIAFIDSQFSLRISLFPISFITILSLYLLLESDLNWLVVRERAVYSDIEYKSHGSILIIKLIC